MGKNRRVGDFKVLTASEKCTSEHKSMFLISSYRVS